ncbi:MAG: chain-length determining protein, partial [Betaproteobacteria bacterium]|nr:chain-length determining protein [Betaproteobacteria bacterium]
MNDRTLTDPGVQRLLGISQLQPVQEAETLDLVEYWRSITKRKWSILGLVLLVAVITTLVVFSLRPSYRSTATVMIEQGKSKVVSIEEVYSSIGGNREYYQTQVEIIKSRELARKTVERLKLATHPDYDPRQAEESFSLSDLTDWFRTKTVPNEDQITRGVVNRFMRDLQVQPIRNSQLVQISFTSFDKELAAKVPNTLADIYVESDLEAKVAMTQKAGAWLNDRLSGLKEKVNDAEKALQEFRDRERIVDAKGLVMSGAAKALEEATSSLVSVRARRAEAESLYNQV